MFNNYVIVLVDKFMLVDMYVLGCLLCLELFVYGIFKLCVMILFKFD